MANYDDLQIHQLATHKLRRRFGGLWRAMSVLLYPLSGIVSLGSFLVCPLLAFSIRITCADVPGFETDAVARTTENAETQPIQTQLEMISGEFRQTFAEQGLSPKSLQVQQKFAGFLEELVSRNASSSQRDTPAGENGTQQGGQQREGDVQLPEGDQSGSAAGATAGQPPATTVQPQAEFQNLSHRENLSDAVWGHLPPQERNDLLRTYSESYLPGYELQVRRYFEKLARRQREQLAPAVEN